MKRNHKICLWTIVLLSMFACSDKHEGIDNSEARKQFLKNEITRVQKNDSLEYYIGHYLQEGDYYAAALAYNTLGRNFRNKACYTEALDAHNKSLSYAVMAVDTPEIVQAYNNLGTDYRRLGSLKEASLHHYKALEYSEKYSDKDSYAAIKNRVVSLNGIGNIHLGIGDMKVAEKTFRLALEGETKLGSDLGCAINYANLGAIFESYEQYDSARVYYSLSMDCNVRAGSTLGVSLCHDHFGRLYEVAEKYDSALVEYETAYMLMQDNNDSWHALKAAISVARIYMHQGQRSKAYPYLKEAVEMAEMTKSYGRMAEAFRMLATYEELSGNHKAALAHYKQSVAYSDSADNEEGRQQLRDSYVEYEKGQSLQQVENIRTAYEEEVKTKRMVLWTALVVVLCALTVIALLWYALYTRRANIRMLERLERIRTTFFTNITHEFRTPLTVILGLSNQLQQEDISAEEQKRYFASIERQGRGLLGLVNQLLDLTKLASGMANATWVKADIVKYVRHTLDGYTDYARLRKVDLSFHAQVDELILCFVPEYIDKIVRNLLSNAFKYTPANGRIAVDLVISSGEILLQVSDSGKGISVEDLPHVFELFYQGGNNTDMVGTGVGLPFVKQMTENMGGSVEAKNCKLGGAKVVVKLPLEQSADIQRVAKDATYAINIVENIDIDSDSQQEEQYSDEKRPIVLVAEDNLDVAEYIRALLQKQYEVHTVSDGYEALLLAEDMNPDLIITDIMMPEMDGYELCSQIRTSDLLCHIPIIVVTARSEDSDRIRGIEEGADAYLQKPFNPAELLARVNKLIEQRRKLQERFEKMLNHSLGPEDGISEEDRHFLNKLKTIVNDHMNNGNLCVEFLAEQMCMSHSALYRKIRTLTGYSISSYILNMRMEKAKQMLLNTTDSVGDVAMRCGFDDSSYFTRIFRNSFGCTPSQIRKQKGK